MIYNKVTLSFPDATEKGFLQQYFFDSLFQVRVSFLIVTFLYGIFGWLDSLMFPEFAPTFHFIRFVIVVPLLSIVFLLSFTSIFKSIWQQLLFISLVTGGIGIAVMIMIAPESYAYYAGMMLIFLAGYFFIRLRFLAATIAGWLILFIYNSGEFILGSPDVLKLINTNFFFVSANLMGMFAAYNIEFSARRNYHLNSELDKEKSIIKDLNRNLEKTVEERTIQLQKAKEKAEESDRLKTAFLANMSHEIRTPMNGILGFSELLKDPQLTPDEQTEYLSLIEKSGTRMLNTINDIIDISRIETRLINLNHSTFSLNEVFLFQYNFFKKEAETKGLRFIYHSSPTGNGVVLSSDKEKVHVILSNLIKNAIKFTNQGEVSFGYRRSQGEFEVFVKDTGIGIPKSRQNAIFDRFVQADIADKMAYQGAGLGLSIAKAYVEMIGGKIWVESEDGLGSVFYFTLPVSF